MNGEKVVRRRRRWRVWAGALPVLASCLFVVALAFAPAGAQQQQPQRGVGWMSTRPGAAGKDLNTVYFTDGKRGWMGGDGGLVYRTEDGGRTWLRQAVGTNHQINDLYFHNKEDGYLVAGNAIHFTEDGGRAWREARRFSQADFNGLPELYSVRFASKKKGWIVGSISRRDVVTDSLVLHTDDAGATWRTQLVPSRDELIHLDFADDKRGWIAGDKGTILSTTDGGLNWSRQRTGTNATLYHVHFIDDERGWAVGERATILRTTNGGETWTPTVVPGLQPRTTFLSVQFAGKEIGWIVGRGGVILRSDDGGRAWVQQESGTKQHLYALFIGKKENWAVGGDGMVLRYER